MNFKWLAIGMVISILWQHLSFTPKSWVWSFFGPALVGLGLMFIFGV